MDLIACHGASGGENNGISDFLFTDHLFESGKQVCLVFESQNQDAIKVASGDGVDVGNVLGVGLCVVLRIWRGIDDFASGFLGDKRDGCGEDEYECFHHPQDYRQNISLRLCAI